MMTFVVRRFLYSLLLLFLASLLVFYGLRLAPGDIVSAIATPTTTKVVRISLTKQLGLDKPLAAQYFIFVKHLLTGNPGISVVNGARITSILSSAGPKTLGLGIAAAILTYTLAIPLGVVAAWRRNGAVDQTGRFLVVLGMGIPNFFLAVLLIQFFAVNLGWFPVAGPGGFSHLVLPAVVLCVEAFALNVRLMRSSMLEELSQDYIRTLRAKGLSEGRIVWVHAVRNALPPVIALAGVILPTLLGYTLVVETVFRYEGLGYQFVQSIINRDYALAQTLALLFTALVIFFNFLADVAHQLVDPRVRESARAA
jgi:ABC-type dipeptide/oligopeptide/nickel transport system permease component